MSQRHQDALAHLKYGLFETNGFVLLTGEVGTGKTALCRCLLEQLPESINVAFVLNPRQTALELLANICDELHINYPQNTSSIKILIDQLNKYLLENHANGKRTVLIIDEAQNLSDDVLEQVRLLTNLETSKCKLLQILLAGQPELQAMLDRPVLRQLTQRITARCYISSLTRSETGTYIRHRMGVAGVQRPIFSKPAISKVYELCKGTPRLINIICDRALLGAYAQNADSIDSGIVAQAAQEIFPVTQHKPFGSIARVLATIMLLLSFAVLIYTLLFIPNNESVAVANTDKPISVIVPLEPLNNLPPAQESVESALTEIKDDTEIPSSKSEKITAIKPLIPKDNLGVTEKSIPVPEVAATATSTSNLTSLLSNHNCNSSSETAISALFQLWGKKYQGETDHTVCESAHNEGLRCLQQAGTWNNIRRYNRPAIVELLNPNGNWQHLLVTEISEDSILLSCGNEFARVSIGEADSRWFGEFLLLWKAPKKRLRFERGDKGYDVLLLRKQIEVALDIEHSTNDQTNRIFDQILEKQVIKFQRAHLLKPDGVVGKDTMILLNTLVGDSSIPLLHSDR